MSPTGQPSCSTSCSSCKPSITDLIVDQNALGFFIESFNSCNPFSSYSLFFFLFSHVNINFCSLNIELSLFFLCLFCFSFSETL